MVLTEINKMGFSSHRRTGRFEQISASAMAARSKGDGTLTNLFLRTGWLNAVKFGSVAGHGVSE